MATVSPMSWIPQRNWILPLLALGFLVAAWAVVVTGEQRVSELDLSRWGTDLDIPERLPIDKYVACHFRPYIWTAMALEGLAYAALCWSGRRGRPGVFGVAVWIVWLLSVGWHGLNWLVTSFFVTEGVRF
jgi:hypothetical protein